MSLRGLYRYLDQRSKTHILRDGRHVYIRWRRGDEVHSHAVNYLRQKGVHGESASRHATYAIQDLLDLKLINCTENNESRT